MHARATPVLPARPAPPAAARAAFTKKVTTITT